MSTVTLDELAFYEWELELDEIVFPFEARTAYLTSRYGPRWGGMHAGRDYATITGTWFCAPINGRVVIPKDQNGAAGRNVWVVGDNGDIWKCFHLLAIDVLDGTRVRAGQRVARTNNTGSSTGPHAHVEFWPKGTRHVDPGPLLDAAEQAGRFPGWHPTLPVPPPVTAQEFLMLAKLVQVAGRPTISRIDFEAQLEGTIGIDGIPDSGSHLVGGVVRYDYPGIEVLLLHTTEDERKAIHVLDGGTPEQPGPDAELVKAYDNLPRTTQAM